MENFPIEVTQLYQWLIETGSIIATVALGVWKIARHMSAGEAKLNHLSATVEQDLQRTAEVHDRIFRKMDEHNRRIGWLEGKVGANGRLSP